jgi:serine protease Do
MSRRVIFTSMLMAAFLGGLIAIGGYHLLVANQQDIRGFDDRQSEYRFSSYLEQGNFTVPEGLNFVVAAELVTPGVVHVQSLYKATAKQHPSARNPMEDLLKEWFGEGGGNAPRYHRGPASSSGSGVIISEDGYIATNYHVVANASEVEVTLFDKKKYKAEIVGTDPTTDLALLKVKASNLPYVRFGNSDEIKVGEWVLAVGNPFNLTSTVTAGIVSAKARNINILRDRNGMQIESFIQTDAAVNPGNSGGALVNLKGELIGINTAIATQTGSYSGYSFAVPAILVKKVMDDLVKFGVVQRALLGINIADLDDPRLDLSEVDDRLGVYVIRVNPGGAADDAGIKERDIIKSIDGVKVNSVSELQEQVARNRPGDKIKIEFVRNGKKMEATAILKNIMGDTEVVVAKVENVLEGASFVDLSAEERNRLKISGGAKVDKLGDGKWKEAGIKEGFVITAIDKQNIESVADLFAAMQNKSGGILIEGVQASGEKAFYGLGW